MLAHGRSARTGWIRDLAVYWRESLFWMLLLPAFGALGSIRPRRQIGGLIEACAFLLVAISSTGKLKSLGLEFANWNRVCGRAAAACVVMGLFAGGAIVVVASLSRQPLGTESGWNKAVLAVALGPVLEEVIFRGYLLTAALLLTRRQRLYLVEQVQPPPNPGDATLVSLSCVDDDAQGQALDVLWEHELDAEIRSAENWQRGAVSSRGRL